MRRIALILLILFLLPFSYAKSYTLDKAVINMNVNNDSSITISEYITFDFHGSFTYAYLDLKYNNERIEDVKVYENNKPLRAVISEEGHKTKRVKWYYSANNEKRTFLITYTLKYALKVYDDVAEFNWKVWGGGWDHSLSDLEGSFDLPTKVNNKDVYTWGHPKLNGKIGIINNQTIVFQTFKIPKQQWVELHIVFPKNILKTTKYAQMIHKNGLAESSIMKKRLDQLREIFLL